MILINTYNVHLKEKISKIILIYYQLFSLIGLLNDGFKKKIMNLFGIELV